MRMKKIYRLDNMFLAFFFMIGALLLRPTWMGENYNSIGCAILSFVGILICHKNQFKLSKEYANITILVIIFWLYIFIQSIILAESQATINLMFNSVITNLISTFIFAIMFSNHQIKYRFIRLFIIIMAVMSLSYTITFILSCLSGGMNQWYIFKFNYNGYPTSGSVYFPFSITYNEYNVLGIHIRRFLGLFREVGITQMFYSWSFFIAPKYFKKSGIIRMLLALGVLFSFSFSGYIFFTISILFSLDWSSKGAKKRNLTYAIFLILIVYLMMNIEDLSITGKASSGSLTARTNVINTTIDILKERPLFGAGYANNIDSWETNINLIGLTSKIGLVGFILYFMPIVLAFKYSKDKKLFIVSMCSPILTILTSQPLVGHCLMAIFYFEYPYNNKLEEQYAETQIKIS